ncbi:hypothetical protein KA005_02475 [bacterium]|nr:hypothetical protein [bacterium]
MVSQEVRLAKAADKILKIVLEDTKTVAETHMLLHAVIDSLQMTRIESKLVKKYGLTETKA